MLIPTANTLGEDLERARRMRLDKAIERAVRELKRAAETGQHDAEETLSKASAALSDAARSFASDIRERSADLKTAAKREVRDHPVVTATFAAAVLVSLAGLIMAIGRASPRS